MSDEQFRVLLEKAVKIDPPPALAERVLRRSTGYPVHGSRYRQWFALLLAGCLVAATLAWRQIERPGPHADLGNQLLEHIRMEPLALAPRDRIDGAALESLLRPFGLVLDADLGPISYAQRCRIGETNGLHLVLPGHAGPVSLLILPGIRVGGPRTFGDDRLQGLARPAGPGSIALIGASMADLGHLARRLHAALRWDG